MDQRGEVCGWRRPSAVPAGALGHMFALQCVLVTERQPHAIHVAWRLTRVLRLVSAVELCAVTWLLFKPSLEEFLVFVIFQKKILHSKVK